MYGVHTGRSELVIISSGVLEDKDRARLVFPYSMCSLVCAKCVSLLLRCQYCMPQTISTTTEKQLNENFNNILKTLE